LSADQSDIIKCTCGQRMRVPAESQSNVFKCVRCGSLVERSTSVQPTPGKSEPGGEQSAASLSAGENVLLDIFVDSGLINERGRDLIKTVFISGKEKVYEAILRLELVTLDQFYAFMAKESGTAAINLAHFTIDKQHTELIPMDLAIKHWLLPIDKLGRSLTVAMVCPMDAEAIREIEHYTGLKLRPMLCRMDEFRQSLQKHYRVPDEDAGQEFHFPGSPASTTKEADEAGTLGTIPLEEALSSLEVLPIQSRVLNQVDTAVGIGPEGLRQIIVVIEKTPPLAATMLSMANSHAYGIGGNVESIPMAAALLGEESVAVVVAALPKYPATSESQWFPLNRFSRNVAEIAAVLAADRRKAVPNIAYCTALLHGIGSYALGAAAPDEYRKIDSKLVGLKRYQAEEQVFGIGHTKAGAILCRSWNLPEIICTGISFYLTPAKAKEYRDLTALINIAVHIVTPEGKLGMEGLKQCADALNVLNISPEELTSMIHEHIKAAIDS
jgi:HD-like signal output (HDOD) protein